MSTTFDFGFGSIAAHQHPNGKGWVADSASVDESAYVGSNAWVSGDARVYATPFRASRSDGYDFVLVPVKDGNMVIIAGCRYFTFEQAREHWSRTRPIGTPLGDETHAILNYLEAVARIQR